MEIIEEQIAKEIETVIKKHYPHLGSYYLNFLGDMAKYLSETNEYHSAPETKSLTYNYVEYRECTALNDAISRMEYHLIKNKEQYIWGKDNPKDEYERGIYNAMRLLNAIVHWANPS